MDYMKIQMSNRVRKDDRGVTLVALIVSIVVLLILAGVSINAAYGDNGLISTSKGVAKNLEAAESEGQKQINSVKNEQYLEDGTKVLNDSKAPTINSVNVTQLSDSSLKISVNVTETGSGLDRIEYSIDGGKSFLTPNYKRDASYVFENLDIGSKEFTVMVKAVDVSGNASSATKKWKK